MDCEGDIEAAPGFLPGALLTAKSLAKEPEIPGNLSIFLFLLLACISLIIFLCDVSFSLLA
jgi:hypothetical protein